MDYPIISIVAAICAAFLVATAVARTFAAAGFPLPPAARRIGCVDGLRGYLALAVMAHHFVIWLQIVRLGGVWGPPGINFFNQLGTAGVGFFFMTTGLVFYPRVLAGFEKCDWTHVYVSRSFRLIPAIAVSVSLIVIVIVLRTGRMPGFSDLKPMVLWVSAQGEPPLLGYEDSGRLNAYVLWSLRLEWIFYIVVLPLCAFASDVLRRLNLPSWLVLVLLAVWAIAFRWILPRWTMPEFLPHFVVGMLGYEVQRREAISHWFRTRGAAVVAILLLAVGMTVFPSPLGVGLPLFGFFFLCVACGNDMFGALTTPGALVLGECSYSIYLLHGLMLNVLFLDFAGEIAQLSTSHLPILLPGVVVAVIFMAAPVFVFVERKAIRLGQLVSSSWKAYTSAVSIRRSMRL